MLRVSVPLLIAVSLVASSATASSIRQVNSTAEQQLRARYEITNYGEGKYGLPNYVSGKLSDAVQRGQAIPATYEFLRANYDVFKIEQPELELDIQDDEVDKHGIEHLRFQQYYQGVKVAGAQMTAHFSRERHLKAVSGNYVPDISVATTSPAVSSDLAVEAASAEIRPQFEPVLQDRPELTIFRFEGNDHLVWRFHLLSTDGIKRREFFVDALSGEVVWHVNRMMDAADVGTGVSVLGYARNHIDVDKVGPNYRLTDYTRQANYDPFGRGGQMPANSVIQTHYYDNVTYPGPIGTSTDNVWDNLGSEAPMVDAHVYAGMVYDWMLRELGRNSYDDNGSTMQSIVAFAGDQNNAFFQGSSVLYLYWTATWRSLAGCPDVVAHEWGHGVTGTTSGLWYQHESGALNESFSDMMGAAFEFSIDTLDAPDWFIAENGQINGDGFRSMSDPIPFGDPDTYEGFNWIDVNGCTPSEGNDNCGVHTNSGVGNKWFYLLSQGGTHNGVKVTGIGVANAIKISYQANKYYWTNTSTYPQAAMGTIDAADDLDSTYLWSISVADAWTACGIPLVNPVLAFSADTTIGWVPFSVDFTASSQKTVLSWSWQFGDGGSDAIQSPSHQYSAPGWYDVTCTIDTGNGGRTLTRPGYIAALADSLIVQSASGSPGGTAVVEIYGRNSIPVRVITVPVEFAGSMGLIYDSVSVAGCRTSHMTNVSLTNFDPFNSRMTVRIQGASSAITLSPGNGPVLRMYFTVPSSVGTSTTNPIIIDGYSANLPRYLSSIVDYTARSVDGSISLCDSRGDLDSDGEITISDLTFLVAYMFKSGPAPTQLFIADVECSGSVDIGDITYLVGYMFKGGPAPCICGQ